MDAAESKEPASTYIPVPDAIRRTQAPRPVAERTTAKPSHNRINTKIRVADYTIWFAFISKILIS
jgi:hypothetical protein